MTPSGQGLGCTQKRPRGSGPTILPRAPDHLPPAHLPAMLLHPDHPPIPPDHLPPALYLPRQAQVGGREISEALAPSSR